MCVTARVDEVGAVAVRRRECLKRASRDQVELDSVHGSIAQWLHPKPAHWKLGRQGKTATGSSVWCACPGEGRDARGTVGVGVRCQSLSLSQMLQIRFC